MDKQHAVRIKLEKPFIGLIKDTSISLPVGYSVLFLAESAVLLATTTPSKRELEVAGAQAAFTEKLQVAYLEQT